MQKTVTSRPGFTEKTRQHSSEVWVGTKTSVTPFGSASSEDCGPEFLLVAEGVQATKKTAVIQQDSSNRRILCIQEF